MRFFVFFILIVGSSNSIAKLINWEYTDLSGLTSSRGTITYGAPDDDFKQWSIDGHHQISAWWSLENVNTTSGFPVAGFKNVNLYILSVTNTFVEWGINFRLEDGVLGWNQGGFPLPKKNYITARDPLGAAFDAGWAPSASIFNPSLSEKPVGSMKFYNVRVPEPKTLTLMLLGLLMAFVLGAAPRAYSQSRSSFLQIR